MLGSRSSSPPRPPLLPLLFTAVKPAPKSFGDLSSHDMCRKPRCAILLPHLLERFLDRVLRGFPGPAPPSGF